MTTATYRFARDREFGRRIAGGERDAFRVRSLDFVVPRPATEKEIRAFVGWLTSEFESLRALLVREAEELVVRFAERVEFGVESETVDTVREAVARKDADLARGRAQVNPLTGTPLHVIAYQAGQGGRTLVRVLCSHLAMDFVTYRLMRAAAAEWWRGERSPARPRPTYADWLRECSAYVDSSDAQREIEQWAQFPREAFADLRRRAEARSGDKLVESTLEFSPEVTAALTRTCRGGLQCRPPEALIAVLVAALAKAFDVERVPLTWTTHGRAPLRGKSYQAVPGWLSSTHPLVIGREGGAAAEAVAQLRHAMETCPNRGGTFAWLERFAADPAWRETAAALATPLRINLREAGVRENSGVTSTGPATTRSVGRPVAHHPGKLHLRIDLDIGATIGVSIRSACDTDQQLSESLCATMEKAVLDLAQ